MSQERSAQLRCLARGLTLGCGVCGRRRGLFRRGVVMVERCPRCNLTFERTEGHYIGAIGINTILSFTALFFGLIAFVAATYPDTPAGAWVFALLPVLALVPLLLVGMVLAAGLDGASVFFMFGLLQILTGLVYGLPMPMQPKTILSLGAGAFYALLHTARVWLMGTPDS